MKLHKDREVFEELISATAESIRLPEVYIEKDYWVTRALKNISLSSVSEKIVFKGGTSLSKAYRIIDRFSEDIDLAVLCASYSDSARKKLIKEVETVTCQGLERKNGDLRESKGSRFRKTIHKYPRFVTSNEFGQASPEIVLEINSFTTPEPHTRLPIQSLISDMLINIDRTDLIEQFKLESFELNVLSAERTLVEKLLCMIKASYSQEPVARLANQIRHLYDICMILRQNSFEQFIMSKNFKALCDKCLQNELLEFVKTSDCLKLPLKAAPLFSQFSVWKEKLLPTYKNVFALLVNSELPELNEIESNLGLIHRQLKKF